ncbi:uncharacterized protein N7498_009865 [Penicillium cinerascens]|uniref:Centrosomin N-terminal motif 1 domain-containing protein n=1 Tax=Penicillium cinerascens TaxID=70096 RepID=A0A9W9J5U0_9EURO|nr:uncharacterized protein N7498_009865 [Penicillium cinerascens]KAJ5190880.1 hypothetical protein N7498_009865 [Penicillium cinerascens]
MDVPVMEKARRSLAAKPPHSQAPVYHTEGPPSPRVPSKNRSTSQPGRPRHPSLSRVKGRINMYTPPRMSPDRSWLQDQSPVRGGASTPPQCHKTPEKGTPILVNPTSTLLQDMLKEQRAHRGSRGPESEVGDDNAPRTPERPRTQGDNNSTASEKARKVSDTFSAGLRKPKEMGMREMDQYVSKMNKLNFDLKLEVFHRTQQMGNLEKKLERMKSMEEELSRMHKLEEEVEELREAEKDNRRLRESNEELRQELDRRDQAVTEAVQFICQLESKIEQLELGGRTSQMSPSRLVLDGPNPSTPKAQAQATFEIPERTSSRGGTLKSRLARPESSDLRQLPKAPSFLRDENQSTAALRSLYIPDNDKSHSALSDLTKSGSFHTMNDATEPGSPRLSVLSEASELNPVDTPSKWQDYDKLDIPVRKAVSITSSLDSYVTQTRPAENKEDHVDSWMQSQTIIQRRQKRAMTDASNAAIPTFGGDLFTSKPRGRPRLDTSIFGGARLPPTPDTMSTAYAAVNNGSNGSIAAPKSPPQNRNQLFSGPRLERHRSADELTTRRSRAGSDVTDSMQTNCSDTTRFGERNSESPVIYPFNTVAPKASELLGPGSPNNPALESFTDLLHQNSVDEAVPPPIIKKFPANARVSQQKSMEFDSSPPLTPQDWLAAAKQTPRSRKERAHAFRIERQQDEPARHVISQAAFHDNDSVDSFAVEPEVPGIPTLNMEALEILENSAPGQLASIPEPVEPGPEPRRRFSFRPTFLSRSNGPRRLQSSPRMPDFADDEDGAPSPIIPKTRNPGGGSHRPVSQIIANSADFYSNIPTTCGDFEDNPPPRAFHQSLMAAREASLPTHSATVSDRPPTSHSMEHKRRSSLGIFGWMKHGGKRSEPSIPVVDEAFTVVAQKENRNFTRLTKEPPQFSMPRASTPDSMDTPTARPRSMTTVDSDDTARRPRYMGRRSRRG